MAGDGTKNDLPIRVQQDGRKPTTANVAMIAADTEYSYILPTVTRKFELKLRDPDNDFKLNLGKFPSLSGSVYITVPQNSIYYQDGVNTEKDTTLYFQSPVALQVMEIVIWTDGQ
jgi:hypothetical protein